MDKVQAWSIVSDAVVNGPSALSSRHADGAGMQMAHGQRINQSLALCTYLETSIVQHDDGDAHIGLGNGLQCIRHSLCSLLVARQLQLSSLLALKSLRKVPCAR